MILHRPAVRPLYCRLTELTTFLTSAQTELLAARPPPPATASVGEVVHLMQLEQKAVGDVKCGEAHAHGDGPFDPVHAQPFVQSTYDALPSHDLTHGPQNGAVRRARDASRLHASSHHIQRVGGGLSNQAGASAEGQTLVGVRLGSFCFF